jgi:acetolactate synthase small subunit
MTKKIVIITKKEGTVDEMKQQLKTLKKKIEIKEKAEIYEPFLLLIKTAQSAGKLVEMEKACRVVLFGEPVTTIVETELEPSPSPVKPDTSEE